MRFWTKLLIPALVFGLVGVAEAKKADKKAGKGGLSGKIVTIADNTITVASGKKKDVQNVTVTVDGKTSITIDGVGGKSIKDLKAGETVEVTPSTGTATEIKASTASTGKGKDKKKAKKAK